MAPAWLLTLWLCAVLGQDWGPGALEPECKILMLMRSGGTSTVLNTELLFCFCFDLHHSSCRAGRA